MINKKTVTEIFDNLKNDSSKFFAHVADNVNWTVMGTHPLAGVYKSKEDFLNHTFRRLNKVLKEGVILKIDHVFVDGNCAIVEMQSLSTANNGKPFNNFYCWVVKFENNLITEVRAYLDSALVANLIAENEK